MHIRRWSQRAASLTAALLVGAGLVVAGPASPAQAVGPACQNGGVLLVFARGSGAKLNPWSNEANRFFTDVSNQLGSIPNALVQVGDEDGDGDSGDGWGGVDAGEYPAVAWNQWVNADGSWGLNLSGYNTSRETGTNNLLNFLTQRNCPQEAIVLGGYSQGADVVGAALPRLPNAVIPRIGYVALYGDPKFNGITSNADGCWRPQWVKGGVPCRDDASFGVLGPRNPYVPASLETRTGTWCDQNDGICTGTFWHTGPRSHADVYNDYWIGASAPTIAHQAWLKTMELNSPPPTPPSPSYPTEVGSPKLAATRNQDGRLALFYIGTDYNIYYQYQLSPGGWWAPEHRINAHAKGIAVTTSVDGRIEVFYIGGDNSVVHVYQTSPNSHSWSAEEFFGTSVRAITAARNGTGRLEIATVDWNNQIHVRQQGSPNSWGGTNWQHLPAVALDIAMTTAADGRNELFYVGGNGSLMHRWETSVGGAWSGEEGFSASIAKVAASRNQDGRLEVFAIGPNNRLQNKWQWQPNTPWSAGWNNLNGVATQLTSAVNQDGRIELFYVIGDKTIWHQWQNNPGAGQGWSAQSQMYGRVSA